METHTKVSPFKDIKSFFSPSAAAGDGGAGKQLKVHSKQSETRPNCGKLDFASTVPVVEQAAEDTPWCSNAATCGAKPVRQALGTVANGATGGVSAAPASQNNQNRRDSDLTAQETQDGNSPAPSVGFTTPALGLRATHVNMDASDTPLATQTHPPASVDAVADASRATDVNERRLYEQTVMNDPDDPIAPNSAGTQSCVKPDKTAAELFLVADELKLKAEFALAQIRDQGKRLAIVEDSRKTKPTTEPGRALRRAELAAARAESESKKEQEKALKLALRLKKELEKETERGVAENLKLCEKAKRDEEREVLRLAKETAAAVAAEEKQKKKEAARVAKEASLAEAARQKETNKLEREQALVDAKLAKEQALETDKLEKELAKESEKRRLVEVKKANEEALVPELVVFLLKNPRLTSPQVVTQFVDAKVAQDTANKEFVTKVLLRDALREIATPPVNHLDPLRRWGITEIGLTKAGLSEAEADALRVEVPLTSEEKALVTKKEQEAKRNAEKSKLQSQKQKQASVLKGFFSAAPKQKPATEHDKTEVRVAPVSKPLCETRELMFIDAISATNERVGFTYSKEHTLSSWKKLSTRVDSRGIDPGSSSTHVTSLTAGRFGARRGVSGKRTRDALVSSDSSMKTAIERSLADTLAPQRIAKRRKLLSVDCSSEYRDDETVLGESVPLQYRFGFQLGAEQLDSLDQMRKTFPVPGGRPAFWGSGSLSKLKDSLTGTGALSSVSAKALARAPFKRDAAIEYEDELGNFFDSGDEWDEPTEGENLEGSDLEEDDEETAACEKNSDDEALDGFEVPDGYLSEEENGRGAEDELADSEMELETGDDGTHDDERKESVGVTDGTISTDDDQDAFNSRLTQDRSRVTLTQWLERARRQNRPLVISSFAPATPDQRLNDGNNQGGANLLDALRVTRFARAAGNKHMRPLVSMYSPPLTAAEVSDLELLKTSEDKSRRDHDRVRLANEKAAEKTRKDAEKETARCAKELKKAEKERELETKKLDAELKKVERELEKREKQVLKDQRAAEKAAKAQVLAQKTAALLAKGKGQTQLQMTPAKSGTHNKSVSQPGSSKKVSPIKSLFEKAAMAVEAKGRTNSEASIDATAAAPVDTDVFSG